MLSLAFNAAVVNGDNLSRWERPGRFHGFRMCIHLERCRHANTYCGSNADICRPDNTIRLSADRQRRILPEQPVGRTIVLLPDPGPMPPGDHAHVVAALLRPLPRAGHRRFRLQLTVAD